MSSKSFQQSLATAYFVSFDRAANDECKTPISLVYDPATNSTTTAPLMRTTRGHAGLTVVHDTVVTCGGYSATTQRALSSCEQLVNDVWKSIVPVLDKRG